MDRSRQGSLHTILLFSSGRSWGPVGGEVEENKQRQRIAKEEILSRYQVNEIQNELAAETKHQRDIIKAKRKTDIYKK